MIGLYDVLLRQGGDVRISAMLIVGVFLTAALFNAIFYFSYNKQRSYLYFGLFCLVHAIKVSAAAYLSYMGTDFPEYDLYRGVGDIAGYLGAFLLVAFLVDNFSVPKAGWWLAIHAGGIPLAYTLDMRSQYIVLSTIIAVTIASHALCREKEGARFALAGLIGYGVFGYLNGQKILEFSYFIGIIFFIICMSLALGRRIVQQNQEHQYMVLHSATLENQLLKQNIQPHFIMNSLTSLQELLVKNPEKANDFIDALAEEFKIFSKVSGKKLIPLTDELALCHAHLAIMSYRKKAGFKLETQGVDVDKLVPPAMIHTLIENGITHGYGEKREGLFTLSKEKIDDGIRYTLLNDSEPADQFNDDGTGLKYVKSRLQESFPDNWTVQSGPVEQGWKVQIDIYSPQKKR